MLVVDDHLTAPLDSRIVVVSGIGFAIGLKLGRLETEVEPHQIGLVLVDDLVGAGEPVVEELLAGRCVGRMRLAVESEVLGLGGVERVIVNVVPPVLRPVRGGSEIEPLLAKGLAQFADHVTLRAHLHRRPIAETAVIHGEPVVVLSHRDDVLRSGLLEQLGPGVRVPLLGGELGNEILVAKGRLWAEMLAMPLEIGIVLDVHAMRVPFSVVRGNRVNAPVNEDAELGIEIPLRHGVLSEGLPGGLVVPGTGRSGGCGVGLRGFCPESREGQSTHRTQSDHRQRNA